MNVQGVIFFEHFNLSRYTVFESPLKMLSKYFIVFIMCMDLNGA
jgi:hypothetical protein